MGTRHLQTVIDKNGVKRIAQYGQWDGSPDGQGKDILNFLRTADLNKYAENVAKINPATDEQIKEHDDFVKQLNKRKLDYTEGDKAYKEKYLFISRDCGSKIHQLIQDGKVPFVDICEDGEQWCEGFYTIDLQKRLFEAEYQGMSKAFDLDNLPTEEEFLEQMKSED